MKILLAATFASFGLAYPAMAQDTSDGSSARDSWTGVYAGGRLGLSDLKDSGNERVLFDTNLDGTFGDTVRTAAGADAFSPGFCGGAAPGPRASQGCDTDSEETEWAVHAGFDYDLGGLVIGVLGEYGRGGPEDSVTAFSTTPANYVLTRELRESYGVRARAGVDFGSTLIYATGGGVYGKFRNSFRSTNTANAFAVTDGRQGEWGYRVGGGVEQRFGRHFSLGAQYLYTNIEDDRSGIQVTRGTAPATNPFVLTNANGTRFQRGNSDFETHNVSVTASFRF